MKAALLLAALPAVLAQVATTHLAQSGPTTVYGVNLGGLFVSEPWLNPAEWARMGGENCDDCSKCIRSEFALTKALGQSQANKVFGQHWSSWFTQADVDTLRRLKINTVRLPIGWWMVESLKNSQEYYPSGGLWALKRALKMLKRAKIWVMLDIHALPGVSANGQMFAGQCTTPGFYTPENFERGYKASAVLAALIHGDPDFSTVYSLQAINEPDQDPSQTPNLDIYNQGFVDRVRAAEVYVGMSCPGRPSRRIPPLDATTKALIQRTFRQLKLTASFYDKPARPGKAQKGYNACITTAFQSASWQWRDPERYNPSRVVQGPALRAYPYLSFGYVAENKTQAGYMKTVCNWDRVKKNADLGNSPLIAGEWWLGTEEEVPIDKQFLRDFGDAQKLAHEAGGGWAFWNFKVERGAPVGWMNGTATLGGVVRDYVQSVEQGYLHPDAYRVFNKRVCDKYRDSGTKMKRAGALDL